MTKNKLQTPWAAMILLWLRGTLRWLLLRLSVTCLGGAWIEGDRGRNEDAWPLQTGGLERVRFSLVYLPRLILTYIIYYIYMEALNFRSLQMQGFLGFGL